MKVQIHLQRKIGTTNQMIYGQFIEHFHRQVYGGIYDPDNPLADKNGLEWNLVLLKYAGQWTDWVSIHKYWDKNQFKVDFKPH